MQKRHLNMVFIRVWPDIRWPDIDFCRISGYPVSGFLRTGYPAGYPVSGKSTGYSVSGHFAGLSGRIFDYFEHEVLPPSLPSFSQSNHDTQIIQLHIEKIKLKHLGLFIKNRSFPVAWSQMVFQEWYRKLFGLAPCVSLFIAFLLANIAGGLCNILFQYSKIFPDSTRRHLLYNTICLKVVRKWIMFDQILSSQFYLGNFIL